MPGETVLVIDDSPSILQVVQLALTNAGFNVITAADGEEGIEQAKRNRPDLILLDFMMPKMNGYQVCQALHGDEALKNVPVILMSAKGDQVGERFVKKMGIADYITKPFAPEAIAFIVRRTINKHKKEPIEGEEEAPLSVEASTEPVAEDPEAVPPNKIRFRCDDCDTRYSIDYEWVRGKVLKIRCTTCGGVVTVVEPRPPAAEPAPRQSPPVPPAAELPVRPPPARSAGAGPGEPMLRPIPFGKYYLLERINVGGMAEVFRAKTYGVEGFERLLAVKRILPHVAEDEEFIDMFIDEAKIVVQLNHANIAQVFDLGKVEDQFFIALEYVHGKDLRAIFDRCGARSETMPIAQACFITMKVCEGLDYAHNKRDSAGREMHLVHRDVSPQNILVSYRGEVKLADFGIATAAGKASRTEAGILKGKFGYMSPEQVRGLPLDRRSDIFSVGIVLYELLTGERLFLGESDFSMLEKVRAVAILPPSTYNRKIGEELEQIVLKALAKEVEDRYQSAIDLHDDLQAYLYTSGEFYSGKDLARWMQDIWGQEIAQEGATLEAYRDLSQETLRHSAETAGPAAVGGDDAPDVIELSQEDVEFLQPGDATTEATLQHHPWRHRAMGSVSLAVQRVLGDGLDVTNPKAFEVLEDGQRMAERAARERRERDRRAGRIAAAMKCINAVQEALYDRLERAVPRAERQRWLEKREEAGISGEKPSHERAMDRFLRRGEYPSLNLIARWLRPKSRPGPEALATLVTEALRLSPQQAKHLFVLGDTRNVLAHIQEYVQNPELDLKQAAQYLVALEDWEQKWRIVDIPPERQRELAAVCRAILAGESDDTLIEAMDGDPVPRGPDGGT